MQSLPVRTFVRFAASAWFLPAVVLCLFRNVVFGHERLAFRDVSHFYTPLYAYIARRQQSEWLPLWNPLDQTGVPIVGESTTALFYPLRWIAYSLPADSDYQMGIYVFAHLLLAAMTMRWAAMRLVGDACGDVGDDDCSGGLRAQRKRIVGNFAGLVYALSGSVLFLACNPPFLVGAAWLPIAMAIVAGPVRPSVNQVLGAAIAIAMMVLGGDPQTALHVMIVAAFVWGVRRDYRMTDGAMRLLFPPVIAACLAAPQIAGSLDWVRHSNRGVEMSETRSDAHDFAMAPWHALEILSPMPFGELLPVHARWSHAFPGDGRMWTPTVYAGAFVGLACFVGVLGRARLWGWVACVSWLASMGPFGLVWLLQNAGLMDMKHDSSVGGVYWMLSTFVPGYDAFRYPAKWLPMFSFGLSVVASDFALRPSVTRVRWIAVGIALVQFGAWAISYLLVNPVRLAVDQFGVPSADEFWGPFRIEVASSVLRSSFLHGGVAFGSLAILLVLHNRSRYQATWLAIIFLLVTIDLGIAQRDLVPTMSRSGAIGQLTQPTDTSEPTGVRWLRTRAGSIWPSRWVMASDWDRLQDVERVAMKTRWMRWHLPRGERLFNGPTSIRSAQMDRFWIRAREELRDASIAERNAFWKEARTAFAIGGEIRVSEGNIVHVDQGGSLDDARHWQLTDFAGGALRRSVYQDGHWSAEWRYRDAKAWELAGVDSINGLCQQVTLPAGDLVVRFVYWPWWQSSVLVVALISWVLLLVGFAVSACNMPDRMRISRAPLRKTE